MYLELRISPACSLVHLCLPWNTDPWDMVSVVIEKMITFKNSRFHESFILLLLLWE